ncbi:MAG: hypothetical protein ACTHJ9_00635 [Rhodanobacter sp.]
MKALELQTFHLWDSGDGTFYADIPGAEWPERVGYALTRKRLTDTEVAAEYWRAELDWALITEGYRWLGICEGWSADEASAKGRDQALRRFATMPHAFDAEADTP